MRNKKRLLSLILAICMVFGSLPLVAIAASNDVQVTSMSTEDKLEYKYQVKFGKIIDFIKMIIEWLKGLFCNNGQTKPVEPVEPDITDEPDVPVDPEEPNITDEPDVPVDPEEPEIILEPNVFTSDDLMAAIESAEDGDVIVLAADSEFRFPANYILDKNIEIVGIENTSLIIDGGSILRARALSITGDNVKISNLTLVPENIRLQSMYDTIIMVTGNNVTFDNVTFDVAMHPSSLTGSNIFLSPKEDNADYTFIDCSITGCFQSILVKSEKTGTLHIDNCVLEGTYDLRIDTNLSRVDVTDSVLKGWLSGSCPITFKGCTFSGCDKKYGGYDVVNLHADTEFFDCSFSESTEIYASNPDYVITLNNCTKDGIAINAENVKEFFEDSDIWNLCDCYVNDILVEKDTNM